ncbi:hypothetical protein BH10CHL1_BH10CHL1_09230 [soil metagenome]
MRTNIEIDDQLMAEAIRLTGLTTKREVVEAALRILIRSTKQAAVLDLAGTIHWVGDLDEMREGRFFHDESGRYLFDQEVEDSSPERFG